MPQMPAVSVADGVLRGVPFDDCVPVGVFEGVDVCELDDVRFGVSEMDASREADRVPVVVELRVADGEGVDEGVLGS